MWFRNFTLLIYPKPVIYDILSNERTNRNFEFYYFPRKMVYSMHNKITDTFHMSVSPKIYLAFNLRYSATKIL